MNTQGSGMWIVQGLTRAIEYAAVAVCPNCSPNGETSVGNPKISNPNQGNLRGFYERCVELRV